MKRAHPLVLQMICEFLYVYFYFKYTLYSPENEIESLGPQVENHCPTRTRKIMSSDSHKMQR